MVQHVTSMTSVCEVMMRVRECGLTLNLEKCQFSMSQLTFMGRGAGVADDKVKAVVEAREPESVSPN